MSTGCPPPAFVRLEGALVRPSQFWVLHDASDQLLLLLLVVCWQPTLRTQE